MMEISEMGRPECIKGKRMKNIKIAMLVLVVCLSSVGFAAAQVENDTKEKVVKTAPPPQKKDCPNEETCELWEEFKGKYGERWSVKWNPYTGAPKELYGVYNLSSAPVTDGDKAAEMAKKFISDNAFFLKINVQNLKLKTAERFGNTWKVDYGQYYQGIPVYNGHIRSIISRNGEIGTVINAYYTNISISTTSTISKDEAGRIAKSAVNVSIATNPGNVSLTVLPQKSDSGFEYFLVWIVPIQAHGADVYKVFVDAQSGEVVKKYSTLVSATDNAGKIPAIPKYSAWLGIFILIIVLFLWRRRK